MTLPKLPSWGEVAPPTTTAPAPAAVAVPARPANTTPAAKGASPRPRTKTAGSKTATTKTSKPKASPAQPADAAEPVAPTAPEGVIVRGPARFLGDTDERPARQLATEILSAAVGIVTGGAASTPRPGQATLSSDIFATMDSIRHMVGAAPTGSGKALALDTPIPTPSGWTTMGEIKAGDEVIDETGRPCRVVDAFAVMVDRPCFRLEFSDGASIVADAEHQWVTATRALRFAQAERRRNERRERSIVRMERIEKLEAIASSIADDGYQMTQTAACALLHGLVERSWIAKARKGLSGRNLKKGETFDLRPVLGAIISDLRSRTALASDPPPPFEVTTTEKMAASLRTEDGALNHAVPIAGPLDLPGVELPVEPYVLGAWLGDGSKQFGSITVGYGDLDDMVELLGSAWSGSLTIHRRPHAAMVVMRQERVDLCPWGHNDWRESGTRNNRVCRTCERHPDQKTDRWNECLMEKLRRLDLAHNKHIPQAYLRASIEQRLALLQGLLDTDGTVSEQGKIELSLCDERLAFDAAEIIRSLGIRLHVRTAPASITETDPETGERSRRVTGTRFRLTFTTSLPVFRMPRKSRRLADSGHIRNEHKLNHRYLVAAERVPSVPVRCITVDSPNHLFLAGREMVPTHNSLSYLAPAAALAAKRGERTVISTESLTLQGQIVDKDLPTIAAATVEVCGYRPTFAIHKGWSNFACALRVHHVADLVLEQLDDSHDPFNDTHAGLIRMLEALEAIADAPRLDERRISIDRTDFPAKPVVDVLVWALRMIVRRTDGYAHDSGDRDQCPVDIPDALWPMLSTSTGGCIGVKDCTFGDSCLPARSRERASDADIVVTNHALLGIQAAKGVPVVIGSRKLGIFHHIVVDEAHGLPEWVRGAGAAEVSGVRVDRLVSRLERAWDRMAPPPGLFPAGRALAVEVDDHLGQVAAALQAKSKDQRNKDRLEVVLELEPEDDPLIDVQVQMDGWLERCAEELAVLRKILKSNPAAKDQMIAVWRASEAVDSLRGELAEASDPDLDVARWMEWIPTGEGPKAIVKLSPVNVGGLLAGRVWTGKLPDEEAARVTGRPIPKARPSSELEAASEAANATLGISSADHEDYLDGTLEVDADELLDSLDQWGADDGSDETVVEQFYDLSVVTLSATIPNSFPRDAGVRARTDRYPSPFEDAYAGSLLFIPRLTADDPDFERLTSRWSQPDRPKFDTARHPAWAVELMIDMIDANGGSALILSATSAAGQMYAERLAGAARGRWKVRSQWDPMSRSKTIAEWRADRTGVLVGTKSLMTGVDAPGDTCSLVILDRVPRSRNNPVDEARTRTVAEATETDYWSATNATYVSDAATLLEQAAGRLIRSASDRGVFAVLDPRLHPKSGFKMAARDRRTYMAALEAFTQRTSDQTAVRRMLSAEAAAA